MSIIRDEIKKRLKEKNMSVNALEIAAHLKKGTIQNIMRGKSKNPRMDITQAIATKLDCSVSELFGLDGTESNVALDDDAMETKQGDSKLPLGSIAWNAKLYIECVQFVDAYCTHNNFNTDKDTMIRYINEIYEYTLEGETNIISVQFGNWILRNNIFNEGQHT